MMWQGGKVEARWGFRISKIDKLRCRQRGRVEQNPDLLQSFEDIQSEQVLPGYDLGQRGAAANPFEAGNVTCHNARILEGNGIKDPGFDFCWRRNDDGSN